MFLGQFPCYGAASGEAGWGNQWKESSWGKVQGHQLACWWMWQKKSGLGLFRFFVRNIRSASWKGLSERLQDLLGTNSVEDNEKWDTQHSTTFEHTHSSERENPWSTNICSKFAEFWGKIMDFPMIFLQDGALYSSYTSWLTTPSKYF